MNQIRFSCILMCQAAIILIISGLSGCGKDKLAQREEELAQKPPMTIYAYRAATPPVIDGDISEFLDADSVMFCRDDAPDVDFAASYVLWDEDYFYVAFKVGNRNLRARQTARDTMALLWDDLVEVLVDCDNDKADKFQKDDICYHVNVLGTIRDDRGLTPDGDYDLSWDGELVFGAKYAGTLNDSTDVDEGLTCEMAIPWSEINREPKAGLTMGIDFCHNDRSDVDNSYRYYDWCDLKLFHVPSGYGEVILKE